MAGHQQRALHLLLQLPPAHRRPLGGASRDRDQDGEGQTHIPSETMKGTENVPPHADRTWEDPSATTSVKSCPGRRDRICSERKGS